MVDEGIAFHIDTSVFELGNVFFLTPDDTATVFASAIQKGPDADLFDRHAQVNVRSNLRLVDFHLELLESLSFIAVLFAYICRCHSNYSIVLGWQVLQLIEQVIVSFIQDQQVVLRHGHDFFIDADSQDDLHFENIFQILVDTLVSGEKDL